MKVRAQRALKLVCFMKLCTLSHSCYVLQVACISYRFSLNVAAWAAIKILIRNYEAYVALVPAFIRDLNSLNASHCSPHSHWVNIAHQTE